MAASRTGKANETMTIGASQRHYATKRKGRGLQTRVPCNHKCLSANKLRQVKWRRRESNPRAQFPKLHSSNDLHQLPSSLGVNRECSGDGNCHDLSPDDPELYESLALITVAWPHLPSHLRTAILTIVQGSL